MPAVVLPADLLIYAAAIAVPALVVALVLSARSARREHDASDDDEGPRMP